MGQVTIYLEKEIEERMIAAAKAANLSKSKWIARIIEERVANEWPESIAELAGAWQDFPAIEEIRAGSGKDSKRANL
ncbi:MAG: CopG family transcriptional regulator [Burkholderiales bacterium]|nr:CopG family transcriptional regulator [Nitrosomonas sp.]MCP5273783.1 CopG family transcriptional regulator [Burkholderiales bacterium]